ncbi:MAG: hypothetical protein ACT6TB_22890 [Sphingopyxis sp.]|uniref:hypothetical protein n=1 Tax=Sphingopyxis sp. TaxID=1908224 RepID=UPI004036E662
MKKRDASPPRACKAMLTRLVASLLVALALFIAPLAISDAAMAQMNECSSTAIEDACPDIDNSAKSCTLTLCVSACVPFHLPFAIHDRQFHAPTAKTVGGSLPRLTGITPETEIRPPRPLSEI